MIGKFLPAFFPQGHVLWTIVFLPKLALFNLMALENGLKSLNDKNNTRKTKKANKMDGWSKLNKIEKDCKHRNLLQHKGQEN